jgi:predicted ATPase
LNYGFLTQALDIVEEALALSHETQIIYEKPEIIRLKGEILLAQSPDDPQKAEGCFLLAVESAILQKSKMWELRAASSLARLCLKTDRQEETLARLQAIYVWFTEGFDTPDLIQTRKLLE